MSDESECTCSSGACIAFCVTKGTPPWPALHLAAAEGRVDLCEMLLQQGADVNQTDQKPTMGVTALFAAAWEGRKDVCELLLAWGADADTGLHAAEFRNHADIVALLSAHKEEQETVSRRIELFAFAFL